MYSKAKMGFRGAALLMISFCFKCFNKRIDSFLHMVLSQRVSHFSKTSGVAKSQNVNFGKF